MNVVTNMLNLLNWSEVKAMQKNMPTSFHDTVFSARIDVD